MAERLTLLLEADDDEHATALFQWMCDIHNGKRRLVVNYRGEQLAVRMVNGWSRDVTNGAA